MRFRHTVAAYITLQTLATPALAQQVRKVIAPVPVESIQTAKGIDPKARCISDMAKGIAERLTGKSLENTSSIVSGARYAFSGLLIGVCSLKVHTEAKKGPAP